MHFQILPMYLLSALEDAFQYEVNRRHFLLCLRAAAEPAIRDSGSAEVTP